MEESRMLWAVAIPLALFVICTVGWIIYGSYDAAKDAKKAYVDYRQSRRA